MAEVLAASDIVDVIGARLELKPSGSARFLALCPFHQEKTPSFHVSRDRQMFYCFGCGKGGDSIAFLREHDGLSFVEALESLAAGAGIQLPAATEYEKGEDQRRRRILELSEFAARFFQDTLNDSLKGGKGRRYLKTRSLKAETVKLFGLGYAPEEWRLLTDAARANGFSEDVLVASGLAKQGDRGSCYDFFRDRLMVPIRDVSGHIVAFGGRDLSEKSPAKYVNSQENAAYKKGRVLYGLHESRNALRQEKHALLVEGYFDLMRCFDAGVCNVVAPCGTALTPDQAGLIHRYVPEVVVVFDGDQAGVRAALRGVAILTAAGLAVRALALPDGKDPDDFIGTEGVDAFRALVANARDFVTFYVRMNEERLGTIEGRTDMAREVFTILTGVDDTLRREEYLKRMAKELRLSEYAVRSEFEKFLRGRIKQPPRGNERKTEAFRPARDDAEFVAVVLSNDDLRDTVRETVKGFELEMSPLVEVLLAVFDEPGGDLASRLNSDEARALYAAACNWDHPEEEKAETLVRKRVIRLKRSALEAKAQRLAEEIRQAERSEDTERVMALFVEKVSIDRAIQELDAA